MSGVVLIDAENTSPNKMKLIVQVIHENYPNISIKRVYGDFSKKELISWKKVCLSHSLLTVQQFSFVSKKGSSDMKLCIDAMDLLHTHEDIDVFCIVTSDSDFTPLAQRLRENGKFVFGIGKRQTPNPFVIACNMFTFIETLEETKSSDAKLDHIISVLKEKKLTNLGYLKERLVELGYDKRMKMKPLIKQYEKHISLVMNGENAYATLSIIND